MMKWITLTSVVTILAGCGNNETRDVQYFLDHPEERKEVFEKCQNNPGKLRRTPECVNVFAASKEANIQEMLESVTRDK